MNNTINGWLQLNDVEMIYGESPSFDTILRELRDLHKRMLKAENSLC